MFSVLLVGGILSFLSIKAMALVATPKDGCKSVCGITCSADTKNLCCQYPISDGIGACKGLYKIKAEE